MRGSAFDSYAQKYACWHKTFEASRKTVSCAPEETSLPNAMASTGAHTVWFIGDSVLMQVAFVAGCLAYKSSGGAGWNWVRPAWASLFRRNEKAAGGVNCASSPDSAHRMCFITAVGHHSSPTIAHALLSLGQRRLTRGTDVAFVTPGAWRVENASHQQGIVQELLDLIKGSPPGLPRIVFSEPLAAHFPTPDGWWAAGLEEPVRCRALTHRRRPPAHAAVHQLLSRAPLPSDRFAIADGMWAWSASMDSAHPGSAPGRPGTDCTHYCLFSGVAESIVRALARRLHSQWATSPSMSLAWPSTAAGRRLQGMPSVFRVPGGDGFRVPGGGAGGGGGGGGDDSGGACDSAACCRQRGAKDYA